ncbi:FAD-binding domain-containing protein [Macroventuria anomochaeta]|uniref:FAD-binding domain-containing protein n=1 Tax=Macroventuria anomochaeta TaxID=301207 RepID=A0ACB6RS76_9PLEO|nr:FAD-binding domain-containing protein [Macroventuria anomochaeta]KAF2624825.1 FAD-binding domain-containing protein [Macroventuria anomochaeta]
MRSFLFLTPALAGASAILYQSTPSCKSTPLDSLWPSEDDWASLNTTIKGSLLRTIPAASACWHGNPFGSTISCETATDKWFNGTWHSQQPESIDYQIYANNTCLPKDTAGYSAERGCSIRAFPQFIVNATEEAHVAYAMKWASDRDIRVVVKGTGHDLNGRSSGAYALAIWTRNFNDIKRDTAWTPLNSNDSTAEDVFVVGSGQQWGNVLSLAMSQGRVVTTGQDPSVGLGGYIQGGGHGPLSRTYGLASNQVLQLTVATATGKVLIANAMQNQDLFWALRGGGPGQYGVVTEYVIKHYPAPSNVTLGILGIKPRFSTNVSHEASWTTAAAFLGHLPDLMDAQLAGAATVSTGNAAPKFFPDLASQQPFHGVALNQVFWAFNTTPAAVEALLRPVIAELNPGNSSNSSVAISLSISTFDNYTAFFSVISGDNAAGGESVTSSRLLGRRELVDTPQLDIVRYLKIAMASQNSTEGTYATIGLQGGPGVRNTHEERWGALLPAWRTAYLHFISTGATSDSVAAGSPKKALGDAAKWYEETREPMWRKWAPGSGAYMNEANPFNKNFAEDYYGEGYERLRSIKAKYDPKESLFVLAGVGSDAWEYDLDTGRLCRVQNSTTTA